MVATQSGVSRAPRPSSLADVLDLILDKGLVIDAYVRVSALGIEILTIDARIVVASVDTYLHFAEAVNRLDLTQTETQGITGLTEDLTEAGAKGKVRGAVEGGKQALGRGNRSGARAGRGS
jgi:gas vesicle structural protein